MGIFNDSITGFFDVSSSLFLGLSFAGAITMATLQVIKELTPVRRRFQQKWYEDQLNVQAQKSNLTAHEFSEALIQLYELSVGGFTNALYNLPAEGLGTQMGYAVQGMLDNPIEYANLIKIMAYGLNQTDLTNLAKGIPTAPAPTDVYFESRNRVSRAINRNLEGINLSCSNRWKFWMNFSSISMTMIIVVIAVCSNDKSSCGDIALAVLIGFVGGYLAPITRDLLQIIQSFRK